MLGVVELGSREGVENIIRIYSRRKESIFNKGKNKNNKNIYYDMIAMKYYIVYSIYNYIK